MAGEADCDVGCASDVAVAVIAATRFVCAVFVPFFGDEVFVGFEDVVVKVPWSVVQVAELCAFQLSADTLSFVCPHRSRGGHRHRWGDLGGLKPTVDGLLCESCGFRQDWVVMRPELVFTVLVGGERLVGVHPVAACLGEWCCVHNPSPHHMVGWSQHWRADRVMMERVCSHGVGHPDPDDLEYLLRSGSGERGIHGCDGCCVAPGVPL